MNKAIEFIKKYKIEIYAIIVTIFLILFVFSSKAPKVEIDWKQKYDNLSISILNQNIAQANHSELIEVKKNTERKQELKEVKKKADSTEIQAHSDVKFTATCDSALQAKNAVISKQDTIIKGDSIIYWLSNYQNVQKDSIIQKNNVYLQNANENIKQLQKSNKRTVLEKHGVVIGILLTKAIDILFRFI